MTQPTDPTERPGDQSAAPHAPAPAAPEPYTHEPFTQEPFSESSFARAVPETGPSSPYAPTTSGTPLPGTGYPGPAYPGAAYPPQSYPGQPYAVAGAPATAYPGIPAAVAPAPTRRPVPVIVAAIILIVGGVFLAILTGALMAAGINIGDYTDTSKLDPDAEQLGQSVMNVFLIVQIVLCLVAAGIGVWLLVSRSNAARICATIAAVLLAITCYGIVASIAVPILLFAPESAKKWFRAEPEAPLPPAPY
ncbi:hypothetical protein MYK68_03945 [Gordonia sp. PP30]|uniref:hypothetical protein n=1 Tax=Gordonia sp. PP30 TaxID=2935861 RepID=UPI001FFF613E|nr:hypothetical protein [Gordonia sp. PP30]UQE75772.1 hypothetical protein MYK68_03945 [Gordonia sp. PP30]